MFENDELEEVTLDDLDLDDTKTGVVEEPIDDVQEDDTQHQNKERTLDRDDPKDREIYALRRRMREMSHQRRDDRSASEAKIEEMYRQNQEIAKSVHDMAEANKPGNYSDDALDRILDDENSTPQERSYARKKQRENRQRETSKLFEDIKSTIKGSTRGSDGASKEDAAKIFETVAEEFEKLWNPHSKLRKAVNAEYRNGFPTSASEFRDFVARVAGELEEEESFISGVPAPKRRDDRKHVSRQQATGGSRSVPKPTGIQSKAKKLLALTRAAYRTGGDANEDGLVKLIQYKDELAASGDLEKCKKAIAKTSPF